MPRGIYDRATAKPRPMKTYPAELVAAVRALTAEDTPVVRIAEALSVGEKVIRRVMARYDLHRPEPGMPGSRCRSGRHLFQGDNIIPGTLWCRTCSRERERRYMERQFAERHTGHDVIPTIDGRRYCRTCTRGDHDIDDMAVVRAIGGEPPERLRVAEREQAIVELRAHAYTYELIAERVGCTLRTAWYTCSRLGVTTPAAARAFLQQREEAAA